MAHRFYAPSITVPAGTASAAPHTVDVSFAQGTVTEVQIIIPDGHAGFTGLQLLQARQQVIPLASGQWIVGNDDRIDWPVNDQLNNGNWQLSGYNTDVFDHTFYVRFLVSENDLGTAGPLTAGAAANIAVQAQIAADTAAAAAVSADTTVDEGVV